MEAELQSFTHFFLAHCTLKMRKRAPKPSVILVEHAQLKILFTKDPMFGSFFVAVSAIAATTIGFTTSQAA